MPKIDSHEVMRRKARPVGTRHWQWLSERRTIGLLGQKSDNYATSLDIMAQIIARIQEGYM